MSARNETLALMQRLGSKDIYLSFPDANTLRRAQLTLHRWAEQECGDGNDYASWAIERDASGVPYRWTYQNRAGTVNSSVRIADREAGAINRISEVCQRNALHYFHQTDPRGCALYVSKEPLSDSRYTDGVACC